MKRLAGFLWLGLLPCLAVFALETDSGPITDTSATESLFVPYKVWNMHMDFTTENWETLNPERKFLPKSEGGDGGAFGWGGFIAPAFIEQGDTDGNGKLSEQEFAELGRKWHNSWGEDADKQINAKQIDDGFKSVMGQVAGGKIPLRGTDGERNGIASVLGLEYPDSEVDMEFDGQQFESTSIRYKGNGTYLDAKGTNQKPFKLDLNDGYPGRKLAGVVKINLHNNITDPSYMNEVIAHQLFRDAGVPAPRTTYTRVYVTVPDLYDRESFGLYSIVENVDKRFIDDRFGTRKGAIFKPVTPFLFKDLGEQWSAYNQIYDPKTELKEEEKWRLIDLCRLVSHSSDYEFASRIGDFVDLDEFARYLAVTVLISDIDGILGSGQNFYLYLHPKSDKFVFIPWDQDHSFGHFKRRSQAQREQLSIQKPWEKNNRFLERLFELDEFKQDYMTYMKVFNDSLFNPERINDQVDALASVLRPAIQEGTPEKIELFNRLVSWDSHHSGINGTRAQDTQDTQDDDYKPESGLKPIKGFVSARTLSVDDQLAGRSEGLEDVIPGEEEFNPLNGFFSSLLLSQMDFNQDGLLAMEEIDQGFAQWYSSWCSEPDGVLTEKQIKTGLSLTLSAMRAEQQGS